MPVGTVSGIEGYGSVHVRTAEIAALFRNPQHVGLAPSAFGVSAGVKTGGAIQSLIGQGYMTVTDVPDARTGVVHQRVLDADTESFHARFLTWRTGAAETGISSRELQSLARAHSVTPFDTPRGSIAGVFHRQEMLASIRADHGAED